MSLRLEAGLTNLHELAPPGAYERRGATVVNPGDLYPAFRGPYLEDLAKLEQPYGPTLGLLLSDALVIGQGSVVTRNGLLIRESCRAILEQSRTPPGLRPVGPGWICELPEPVHREDRISILAKAPWWRNYGHWLVDSAALLALVVDRLRGNDVQIVVGKQIAPAMRRIVAETLGIVAPGIPVVEHDDSEPVMFSRLYYVTPTSVSPLFKLPEALRALRGKLVTEAPRPARRLYVQRDAQGPRTLLNEPDVLRVAASHGFEVVRPERLGLREQAQLFSEAAVVMGVKGAGLTNLVFAPRDSAAVVLSPSNWADSFFWDLAGQLGITYVEVVGGAVDGVAEPPNSPFTIDLARLDEALARATGRASAMSVPRSREPSSRPEHAGLFYRDCLRSLHQILRPDTYLEIGCLDGETLALAECAAIG
ncbi:MAG: glycosyltransferase family 61 protein, partial [Acetobacteraceae bacterium]|nr:glycosyltransferase family 61 protein [Acetobacteraceae bacterium]